MPRKKSKKTGRTRALTAQPAATTATADVLIGTIAETATQTSTAATQAEGKDPRIAIAEALAAQFAETPLPGRLADLETADERRASADSMLDFMMRNLEIFDPKVRFEGE